MHFNRLKCCNNDILTLPFNIYVISSRYYIFLCWILRWRWPKRAETCRSITTYMYIIVSNYSAGVGLCVVTCHAARSLNDFYNGINSLVLHTITTLSVFTCVIHSYNTVSIHLCYTQLQHCQYSVVLHTITALSVLSCVTHNYNTVSIRLCYTQLQHCQYSLVSYSSYFKKQFIVCAERNIFISDYTVEIACLVG